MNFFGWIFALSLLVCGSPFNLFPAPPSIFEIIQLFCASLGKVVKKYNLEVREWEQLKRSEKIFLLCKVFVIQKRVKNNAYITVMVTPFSKDFKNYQKVCDVENYRGQISVT